MLPERNLAHARNYDVSSSLDGQPSVTIAVFQLPGSNALTTAHDVKQAMERLKSTRFPEGIDFAIVYDTTMLLSKSRFTKSTRP